MSEDNNFSRLNSWNINLNSMLTKIKNKNPPEGGSAHSYAVWKYSYRFGVNE